MNKARTGHFRPKFGYLKNSHLLTGMVLSLFLLIGLWFTLNNTQAAGTTWDVNNGAYTNDTNCTLALRQCKTITSAVAAASPGDTINVAAGSENYAGFIVTTSNLIISGPNASNNPVSGSRVSEAQIITAVTVQPSAANVTIAGFEFSRSESKINIKANNFSLKNNIFSGLLSKAINVTGPISNLAIEANLIPIVYSGIQVKQVTNGYIKGNKIGSQVGQTNYLDNAIILDAVNGFQVLDNYITNVNNQAIEIINTTGSSSHVSVSDNYILRANKSGASDQGAIQFFSNSSNSSTPVTVTNNIIQTSWNGVVVETGGNINGNTLVSNNCFNNTISTYADITNSGTGSLTATNNYSGGTTPTIAGTGPVVATPYLPANYLTATSNPSIEGGTPGQSVILGHLTNSNGDNVANQIVSYHFQINPGSNPVEGLLTSDNNGNLVLTLNQPLSIGDYPLKLNPIPANVSSVLFPVNRQGCQDTLSPTLKVTRPCTVNSDGSAGYTSIEAALATPCSTIRVTGGGPYPASLVIDHPVTLNGPNAGLNPNTATRNPEVTLYLTDGFNDPTDALNRGSLVRLTSSNIKIDGFTLDGNNPSTNNGVLINGEDVNAAYGITNRNSSGTPLALSNLIVQNNVFKNFNVGAVRFDGISAAVSNNYLGKNRIDNVFPASDDGYGVYLGDNFYVEVAGNEISRVRQGIKIEGFDANNPNFTGAIHDNTIDSFVAGIRYDNSNGFTVSGNTLKSTLTGNLNTGLWLTNLQAGSVLTVTNNTIVGGDIGIKAWGTASVKINGGSITGANYGVYLYNYQSGVSPATPDINSNLTLDGLTISDSGVAGAYVLDNTASGSNDLTLSLQGASQLKNGATGVIVSGQDIVLHLNNTAFSGQSGNYITLENTGGDGVPGKNIEARAATFEGTVGINLSGEQYAAVQNKLTDKNDTAGLGLVVLYNPALAVSGSALTFSDKVGGSNPVSQSVTVSNSVASSPDLEWSLATPVYGPGATGWLDCIPSQGVLAAGASAQTDCQATTGSLTSGIYTATLQISSTTPGVQNGSQTITVTFKVVAPPVIVSPPAGQSIASGSTVSLTVSATSLAPLSYQWYEGTNESNSTTVGTDSPEFTSPPLTSPTSYWVKVSNFAGSTTSAPAYINICNNFVVDNSLDTSEGTLCGTFSYALKQASLATQPVTITFATGVSGVTLNGALPPLTNPNHVRITIDGGCNNQNSPVVSLTAGTNSGPNGLNLTGQTTVRCLIVNGFSGYAIGIEGDDNRLESSWLGTTDGLAGSGIGGGITINGNNNSLGLAGISTSGNHIFGNNKPGVQVTGGQGNTAYYNKISLVKIPNVTLPANARAVYVASGGQLKFGPGNQITVITAS